MKSLKSIELINWSGRAYGREDPLKIAGVINYEAGDIYREILRMEDYPTDENLYKKQAKVSLGDVLAMSQLLCSMLDFEFEEIYNEGCQRAIDRCQEKLEGKSGF